MIPTGNQGSTAWTVPRWLAHGALARLHLHFYASGDWCVSWWFSKINEKWSFLIYIYIYVHSMYDHSCTRGHGAEISAHASCHQRCKHRWQPGPSLQTAELGREGWIFSAAFPVQPLDLQLPILCPWAGLRPFHLLCIEAWVTLRWALYCWLDRRPDHLLAAPRVGRKPLYKLCWWAGDPSPWSVRWQICEKRLVIWGLI